MKTPRTRTRFRLNRLGKNEAGTMFVEYSVAAALFLTIAFSLMELCSAGYTYTVLADAANEGVHYAMLNSTDEAGAINAVKGYAGNSMHDISKLNVAVAYPDGASTPPNRIAINVSYQYVPYLNLVMNNPPTMHAFAEGRMVH